MNLNEQNQLNLLLRFDGIVDVRLERKKLYPLNEVLFLTISAVISGHSEWEEIVDFGELKLEWLRSYLPYLNGIASHDTVNWAIGLIDYRSFEAFFIDWVESMAVSVGGRVINIDGKKLRASVDKLLQQKPRAQGGKSAVHLVEAWCSELGAVQDRGQVQRNHLDTGAAGHAGNQRQHRDDRRDGVPKGHCGQNHRQRGRLHLGLERQPRNTPQRGQKAL